MMLKMVKRLLQYFIAVCFLFFQCNNSQISLKQLDKLLETPTQFIDRTHHVKARFCIDDHRLEAEDKIQLEQLQNKWSDVTFLLDARLSVSSLKIEEKDIPFATDQFNVMKQFNIKKITIPEMELPADHKNVSLLFRYSGIIWNNAEEYEGNFIAGNIGPNGIYINDDFIICPTIFSTNPKRFMTMTLPNNWKLACSGKITVIAADDQTNSYTIDFDRESVRFAAAEYVTKSTVIGDTLPLSIFFTRQDSIRIDEIAETSQKVLTCYTEKFGRYPYDELIITEVISGNEGGGTAGEGLILLSDSYVRNNPTPMLLAHEISHMWWGSYVEPKHFLTDMWLAEGLATYSEALYNEWESGPLALRNSLRGFENRYRIIPNYLEKHFWASLFKKETSIISFDPTGRMLFPIIYKKGAFIFHMLRRVIEDKIFFKILREYVRTYGNSKASISDFKEVCSKVTGQDLDWFFAQWVEHPKAPKLALKDIQVKVSPDSTETSVWGSLVQQGDKIFKFPVELALNTDIEQIRQSIWIDRERQSFHMKVNTNKLLSLQVDPDNHLLDLKDCEEFVITPLKVKTIHNSETGLWGDDTPNWELSLTFGENEDIKFSNIRDIAIDQAGNVFVLDIPLDDNYRALDRVVYKFDKFGNHLLSIRENLASPQDLALDDEGSMYILDKRNQKVIKYANTGDYITTFDIKLRESGEICIDRDQNILISSNPFFEGPGDEIIHKYDGEGNLLSMFVEAKRNEDFYTENDLNRIAFCMTDDGVFVGYRYDYEVRKYDQSGKWLMRFDRKVPWKIPKLISKKNGRVGHVTPKTLLSSACDSGGNLYLLLGGPNWDYEKPEGNQIIDVFNKIGRYLGKMEPGLGGFYNIGVDTDKNIYLAGSERVCRFTMQK